MYAYVNGAKCGQVVHVSLLLIPVPTQNGREEVNFIQTLSVTSERLGYWLSILEYDRELSETSSEFRAPIVSAMSVPCTRAPAAAATYNLARIPKLVDATPELPP